MQAKDWLHHYLTPLRQEQRDNKQPLYRYTMTDSEYQTLRETLKTSTLLADVASITILSGWNAAFVLYAAEWWRREYDGHSWKWEGIFQSFDADVQKLSAEQRNQLYYAISHSIKFE